MQLCLNNTITIRKATSADADAIHAVDVAAFADDSWPRESFDEVLNEPECHYFIAYCNGAIVGYCGMYHETEETPHCCNIETLAVVPTFRRKGLGRLLVQKMLDTAKELGLGKAELEVNTKNANAIKLYQDFGFAIEEHEPGYYSHSGEDAYIMRRYEANFMKLHPITLHGALREHTLTLRPLSDDHLPLLYKWNTDPEVLYWNEGPDADPNDNNPATVQSIYKETSNAGHCFIIEIDGTAIGECLLCQMTVDYIVEKYPATTDIRRIDILIGEKAYWNKGIGSAIVQMLVDWAFNHEKTDIIYGITGDYNKRSGRIFQKNGFQLFQKHPTQYARKEEGLEFHYRLTRDEYERSITC